MVAVATVITIEQTARKLGITLIIDTDGRLKVFPHRVAERHPEFCRVLRDHADVLKEWLKILAAPT